MRARQVHLDFHTSEKIEGIGEKFSKEQFQTALKLGAVDSITVFSKCHHGWAYHPSKANKIHPHLKFDLLGAQIEAAHEIGVKTPVYLSAGLDEKIAREHPEWLVRSKDDKMTWIHDFASPGYHRFCFNTPYLDILIEQIEEVCENYDADGIFLDIVGVIPCYCQNCVRTLLAEGKDPYDENSALELAERVYKKYTARVRECIDKYKPGLPVFHNGGHIRRGRRDLAHLNTHLELESLPTGGWGYDHFPLSAAYARTLGMDYLGMTGKFHTSWGEFGGFKHPNALRYETSLAAACGAASSVGDQLHPSGEMDLATYDIIGKAYREIKEKEPWLKNAKNISDVALFSVESAENYYSGKTNSTAQTTKTGDSDAGAARMLLEGKYLFDVIDAHSELSLYKVVILPDNIRLDNALQEKFREYINGGGKVLASGRSALKHEEDSFALDLGADFCGVSEYNPSYFYPEFKLKSFESTSFVMYSPAYVCSLHGGEEIGELRNSYFNRSLFSFCSHKHTPCTNEYAHPGIVHGKDGVYIAWEIFSEYATVGSLVLKEMFCYALDLLLADSKTVETDLGAQGVVTVTAQDNRYILHALYASPVKRGKNIEVIEDIVPVYDTKFSLKLDRKASKIYIAPDKTPLGFSEKDGRIEFILPKLENHAMIVIE